ncbi:MAG: hypothetical protein QOJ40_1233 [Verrucomicrobiota bacterium]
MFFWVQRVSQNLIAFKHEAFQGADASDPDVTHLKQFGADVYPLHGGKPAKEELPGVLAARLPDLLSCPGIFGPLFCERFPCISVKFKLADPKILKG